MVRENVLIRILTKDTVSGNNRGMGQGPGSYSVVKTSVPDSSIISSARPPPRATQVKGSSATMTGRPVSSISKRSKSLNNAPPPVNTIPRSAMSAPNSGGVFSNAVLTAPTIPARGSCNASRISLLFRVKLLGIPSARLRPRTSISRTSSPGYALPMSCLMRSAVDSSIKVP